ncbi:hypothetical protein VB734_00420 [Synechococcus sp. BA-124 BA4]|uniref:hypothetical protein n=1 Tax=unclassified Synechococcus TaxID=2626047 RepID=UPI002AD41CCA|nr:MULTISPECIES: hypothetical protein [unclassified Synechococcus]MEA5398506.1 hypothetical protein [Synechococcus sp. BA-124 BA4]CAK6691703.1 hypothetical protein BBFGKLBO_01086 [Synechococcus sp. CBW1107]
MASPPRPPGAAIEAPPAVLADATPEQQLTYALANFQAEVSPITAADLAEVVHSARPAFRRGIGWSAQLREQQGRSRLQVTVMHVAGAELCSESWADEASDLAETTGLMLAMLLGIPMSSQARAVQPYSADSEQSDDKPGEGIAQQACSKPKAEDPSPEESLPLADANGDGAPADGDPGLAPLTPEEVSEVHRRVLELPQATRQELTKAFREHFQVPRNARSIGDRITQRQHSLFIELFLEEAQGQVQAEAPAEPGP